EMVTVSALHESCGGREVLVSTSWELNDRRLQRAAAAWGWGRSSAMFGNLAIETANESVAHIIQGAMTPVFLLSGIAALLNVFSTRLSRVGDKVEQLTKAIEEADGEATSLQSAQLEHLHRRSLALDAAVILGGVGGGATCASVLTLFLG